MARKRKTEAEPFWNELVQEYFSFCRSKFNEAPTFDGSAPREMKIIIAAIKKKAEAKNMIWTEDLALRSWNKFLEYSHKDKWLSKNFVLRNMNTQKDKIFFAIAKDHKPSDQLSYQQQVEKEIQKFKPTEYQQ